MTRKQIEAAMSKIPHAFDTYKFATKAQKKEYAELSCRDMINSLLVYGYSAYNKETDEMSKYLNSFWQDKSSMFYVPRKRIIALVQEQEQDFAQAEVRLGVYTDGEGCTYNSCVWADEM